MTTVGATAVAAKTFLELERAWNLADGPAFGKAFADDADFIDIRGRHHRGRNAVATGHQALLDSVYAGSTIRYQVETARMVTPQCLLVVAGASLDAPDGPAAGLSHARLTAVLTSGVENWSVVSFHNAQVHVNA